MNIAIYFDEVFTPFGNGSTCFECTKHVHDTLATKSAKAVTGVVIIDGTSVKFCYSPYFNDGDILSNNNAHRVIVKTVVPMMVYNKVCGA